MDHQLSNAEDRAWNDVQQLLEDIGELSRRDASPGSFYHDVLQRTLKTLGAAAGSIWVIDTDQLQLKCQIGVDRLPGRDERVDGFRREKLQEVMKTGEAESISQGSGAEAGGNPHPTQYAWLYCPLRFVDQVVGVIEIVQLPTAGEAVNQGSLRLLSMVGELVNDFLRNRRLVELTSLQGDWLRFEQFVQRIHESLDEQQTAYRIVNEARRFLGCDRVSLCVLQFKSQRLLAISGVDNPMRHANSIRSMLALCGVVAATGESYWYTGQSNEAPPQLETALSEYLEESQAQAVAAIPLRRESQQAPSDSSMSYVLLIDQFDHTFEGVHRQRAELVAHHIAAAMGNAAQYQKLPFKWLQTSTWYASARQLPKILLAMCGLTVLTLALALVPADFHLRVSGVLQPSSRQDLFAPDSGDVIELLVSHDDAVEVGQAIVNLRSPRLEMEMEQLRGEYETTRKRLFAVQSAVLQSDGTLDRNDPTRLRFAAEEQELRELLDSQSKQLDLLQKQSAKLQIKSPVAGRVVTWNLERRLESRPVERGQVLLTIADVDGPWVAELKVPDHHLRHIIAARRETAEPLAVSLLAQVDESTLANGKILEIARRADDRGTAGPVVTVTSSIDQTANLRPGTTVIGRIDCGRRSIGYVWLHDLFETAYRWLMF